MTPPTQRVTRGFSIDEEEGEKKAPRRIRTRQQIIDGEGKRPPATVELRLLAHNPFNPREELTEIDETAASLREKGQIQPVTVVRRAAFLAAHPGQEETLGEAEYVVIDGNRRLKAAGKAELAELRIDVNDALAATAADILETALIANVHRVDVAPLDQAKALEELVRVHGSQGKVAKRLGKTPPWVSQRLALLELTDELQEKVESGTLKVEPARRIGRLPKEQQAAEAEKAMAAAKTPRQRAPRTQVGQSQTINAVNTLSTGSAGAQEPESTVNGVNTSAAETTVGGGEATTVNGVNTAAGEGDDQHVVVPLSSPEQVVDALVTRLSPEDLLAVAELLLDRVSSRSDAETEKINV
ncbi:ParB/RepB/Spo0J family partition protein [Streptomyces sp. NPDC050600]|uniref:ParB/RepB/Spo0J family partition protein n=1 Tax=Streptomyces sp. NPDC050600 TaxID=3157213 RepID=UPI00341F51D4